METQSLYKTQLVSLRRALPFPKLHSLSNRELGVIIGVQILMFEALFAFVQFHPYFEELHFSRMETLAGRMVVYFLLSAFLLQVLFLLYITRLFFKYQSISGVEDSQLPVCTVIVPAYNEGRLVYHTLKSITQSDYPKDKLEIFAIDDGSIDDTLYWIKKANRDFPDAVKVIQQPHNKGKRMALYEGFTLGKGEVFVTIDSDSIIEKETLRNMVSPFVKNPDCGAVAGNVKVLNKQKGMIPKMLNVSFVFSFEFIRAAQSSLGFVLCTPGALSAYKREAVMSSLDEWINQEFLGKTATIGEDRAMTNSILKKGYKVVFQRNANVHTNMPIGFRNLHKMFTRWGRSNVRETYMMSRFVFKDFRNSNKAGARLIFLNQAARLVLVFPLLMLMLYFLFSHPLLYIISALCGTFIFSSIQMLFFTKYYNFTESLWAYPYSVFYLCALFWVYPFAVATVRNGGWLTR